MKKNILISLVCGLAFSWSSVYATTDKQLAANKRNVVAFYEAALNQKNFRAASQYLGSRYTQHNPTAADGREGFEKFIEFLKEKFPESHSDIKRVFAEGDYVILHVHSVRVPGTRGRAIIDIFKLNNGKIIEHWDVVQDIPENSANTNTMF